MLIPTTTVVGSPFSARNAAAVETEQSFVSKRHNSSTNVSSDNGGSAFDLAETSIQLNYILIKEGDIVPTTAISKHHQAEHERNPYDNGASSAILPQAIGGTLEPSVATCGSPVGPRDRREEVRPTIICLQMFQIRRAPVSLFPHDAAVCQSRSGPRIARKGNGCPVVQDWLPDGTGPMRPADLLF